MGSSAMSARPACLRSRLKSESELAPITSALSSFVLYVFVGTIPVIVEPEHLRTMPAPS